jgi:hypothetical protein
VISSFSRITKSVLALGLLAAAMVAMTCSGGKREVSEADVEFAQAKVQNFRQELRAALLSGLEGGPEEAVTVCSRTAYHIATRLSGEGVEMGRTSHKIRNPKNAPADWIEPLLAEYVGGSTEPYRAVVLGNGRFGYVEPMTVAGPCLMCHGKSVAPALLERIARHYPEDQATGFAQGDFRGLFWVTMPLGAEEK